MIIFYENKCAKYRQVAIENAIVLAKDELMPRVRKLYINIKPMKNLLDRYGVYGDCMDEEDREFTIRIDTSISVDDMVSTVLHEMVHVKQHVYNEPMRADLPYKDRPHEIEAHALEKQLKEKFDARY
jgi:hypothetical protein